MKSTDASTNSSMSSNIKKSLIALSIVTVLSACTATNNESQNITSLDNFFVQNGGVIVTPETYPTLETSHQILKNQDSVGVNNILHKRKLTPTDNQPVVRMNRDTYYSLAVVDVSKGATITMPTIPAGKYMSIQPITEDHRIQAMKYGAGTFDLSTHKGSHVYVVIRLDAAFSEAQAKEIQDKMFVKANSSNEFTAPAVNQESFTQVENSLKAKIAGITRRDGVNALTGMFTDVNDDSAKLYTDEKYQVGAAIGWGGAQMADNIYEVSGNYPMDQCHQANFEDPKNKAFWSITVYNKKGFMFNDVANMSSNTAEKNKDGTYTVSFGCGSDAPNNIKTANESGVFNLGIRHYQPSDKVTNEGYRILPTVKVIK